MKLNGIRKMILVIFLSIIAIIYVPITVKGEDIPIRSVGLSANDSEVHTTTFYLPQDQRIYYLVSSGWQVLGQYAKLKKDGSTICNLNLGYNQINLSKGNYTIEAYGGGWYSNVGYAAYGDVSVLNHIPERKLIRFHSEFERKYIIFGPEAQVHHRII